MTAKRGPLRFAALGDETIGPGIASTYEGGVYTCHPPLQYFTAWLPVLVPWLTLRDSALFRSEGATSVAIAAQLEGLLAGVGLCDETGPVDGVIICAGLHDCFAMPKGIAPPPQETVASFETMAIKLLDRNMTPIFVVPPPCPDFANGLFADRYIAIAATLRRLARQDERIGLIDATRALVDAKARGIEPDQRFSAGGALTMLGAFKLAQAAAKALTAQADRLFPGHAVASIGESIEDALNPNAGLAGPGGALSTARASGRCPDHFSLTAGNEEGLTITVDGPATGTGGLSLRIGGQGSAEQGFVKLAQRLSGGSLPALSPGDALQANCSFSLRGPVQNVAALTLQLAPVWADGYAALTSGPGGGGPGVPEPHAGILRTPPFAIPAPLTELNVSLTLYIPPGAEREVSALLDVRQIMILKVAPKP